MDYQNHQHVILQHSQEVIWYLLMYILDIQVHHSVD